jgi:HK97 family phage portal protein
MGLLARAVAQRKTLDLRTLLAEMNLLGGRTSKAGPLVSLDNALRVSTAFGCLKVISQGLAQSPFKLFRQGERAGLLDIQPAREHPLYDLLATKPNDWATAFEFIESLAIHAALGNGYAFINRSTAGRVLELILLAGSMRVTQNADWSLSYKLTSPRGTTQDFPAASIWHLRGPSWNGYAGMDVLNLAREALGLAMATEATHSSLHANGVRPSGTYSIDAVLKAEQYEQLKAWIIKEGAGDNAGAPLILDRGAKWLSAGMTGLDAQHLETRRYQIEEVCRFFGVMPIMIGYSDKATTYASSEQMFLAHVVHCLAPWARRIEQSADATLLTAEERAGGLYFKFMLGGLLRGAAKDRSEYFAKALGSGGAPAWMTQDEVRALEELNPMGGKASELPIPSNAPAEAPAP